MRLDSSAPSFGASQLRGLARRRKTGLKRVGFWRSPLCSTGSRAEAAMIGGVELQIIRDWVLHFNERGPDGLLNGKSPGQPSKLNDVQRQAIAGMIESGPIPAVHGVVRWRLIDLAQCISRSSASRSPSRRSAGSCAPWAIASSPHGRAITRKPRARSRILKKLPRAPGRNRA